MDNLQAIETIREKYPKTSRIDMQLFENWLREFNVTDYEPIVYAIIKADNRDSYINQLPTYQEYNKYYEQNKGSIMPRDGEDRNSLNYIFDKTKHMSVDQILDKCQMIRVEQHTEKWQKFNDWERNSRIDFLHWWDVMSAEKYQAGKAKLNETEIKTYLEIVKKAICEGSTWERPWKNEYTMLEFKRINHVENFGNISGKIL